MTGSSPPIVRTSNNPQPPQPGDRQAVLRFAPSPNGYLHLGHALSALTVWHWAQKLNGRFLLRIEDTDLNRAKPHYVDAIYEDLSWLGIQWEEPVRVQSEHLESYDKVLRALWDRNLIYHAPASRSAIKQAVAERIHAGQSWPSDPDGAPHYPFAPKDKARDRQDGFPEHGPLRLDTHMANATQPQTTLEAHYQDKPEDTARRVALDPSAWGDVLLRGRDRPATYHLAVVLDDATQGITHIVRGQDIEPATSLHRLLQNILGLPAPIYHHHRLILGSDGRKLSKSEGAQSLRALRQAGLSPEQLIEQLAEMVC